jgi:hypothetical protein
MGRALLDWTVLATIAATIALGAQQTSTSVTIQGRTINAITGEPVRGALVHLNLDRGPFSNLPPEVEFLTGPDGRFVLRDLPAGTYGLFVTKTGFVDATSDHYELAAGTTRERVEVRLTPAAVISGTVRDDAGDPVPRVTVEVVTRSEGVDRKRGPSATTDAAGRYSLDGLDARRVRRRDSCVAAARHAGVLSGGSEGRRRDTGRGEDGRGASGRRLRRQGQFARAAVATSRRATGETKSAA